MERYSEAKAFLRAVPPTTEAQRAKARATLEAMALEQADGDETVAAELFSLALQALGIAPGDGPDRKPGLCVDCDSVIPLGRLRKGGAYNLCRTCDRKRAERCSSRLADTSS